MRRDRDMDMIRQLLLDIEDGKLSFRHETMTAETAEILGEDPTGFATSEEKVKRLALHLDLLREAGFVEFHDEYSGWYVSKITWKGHDFISSVRDPAVWSATKEGVKKAGGFTVEFMVALAKGFVRKKIEDATGIKLE